MRKPRNNCHCVLMDEYYAQREAWLDAREAACAGYRSEEIEWERDNPRFTFKQFLIGLRRPR